MYLAITHSLKCGALSKTSYNIEMSNRNILGIKFGGHDTAASLLMNGKIVVACAQERFTYDKHSRLFPIDAIKN